MGLRNYGQRWAKQNKLVMGESSWGWRWNNIRKPVGCDMEHKGMDSWVRGGDIGDKRIRGFGS